MRRTEKQVALSKGRQAGGRRERRLFVADYETKIHSAAGEEVKDEGGDEEEFRKKEECHVNQREQAGQRFDKTVGNVKRCLK